MAASGLSVLSVLSVLSGLWGLWGLSVLSVLWESWRMAVSFVVGWAASWRARAMPARQASARPQSTAGWA